MFGTREVLANMVQVVQVTVNKAAKNVIVKNENKIIIRPTLGDALQSGTKKHTPIYLQMVR